MPARSSAPSPSASPAPSSAPSSAASSARRLLVALLLALPLTLTGLAATTGPASAYYGPTRWDCLAHYESTQRWHINTGNGHYGGLQFTLSTWRYYGGPQSSGNKYPHRATRAEQILVGKRTAFRGWRDHAPQGGRNAWPNTWPLCN